MHISWDILYHGCCFGNIYCAWLKCDNAGASCVNSLRPSDAYIRHQNRLTLIQITACRLIGAKPLSEPMLAYFQLDHWEIYVSEIRIKIQQFYWKKNDFENVDCKIAPILCHSRQSLSQIRAYELTSISFRWDIITNPWSNLNDGLTKPTSKLGHGCVIT